MIFVGLRDRLLSLYLISVFVDRLVLGFGSEVGFNCSPDVQQILIR